MGILLVILLLQEVEIRLFVLGPKLGIAFYKHLTEGCSGEDVGLFSQVTNDRLKGNSLKFALGRFRLDIRRNFLTERVFEGQNRLPREVVEPPCLQVFQETCGCVTKGHGLVMRLNRPG